MTAVAQSRPDPREILRRTVESIAAEHGWRVGGSSAEFVEVRGSGERTWVEVELGSARGLDAGHVRPRIGPLDAAGFTECLAAIDVIGDTCKMANEIRRRLAR